MKKIYLCSIFVEVLRSVLNRIHLQGLKEIQEEDEYEKEKKEREKKKEQDNKEKKIQE